MSFKYNTAQLADATKEHEIVAFLNSYNPTKFSSAPITLESYEASKGKRIARLLHVNKYNAMFARVAVLQLTDKLNIQQKDECVALWGEAFSAGLAPTIPPVEPVTPVENAIVPVPTTKKMVKPIKLNLSPNGVLVNTKRGVHNLVLNGEVFHPRLNPCEGVCIFTRNPYLPYLVEVSPFEGVTVEWLWDSQLVDMGYKDGTFLEYEGYNKGKIPLPVGRVGITTHWVAPKSASGKLVGNTTQDLLSVYGGKPQKK
jgi:hypothetical protein